METRHIERNFKSPIGNVLKSYRIRLIFIGILFLCGNVQSQNIELVGDTIELSVKNDNSNTIKWQFSNDRINWKSLQGLTGERVKYKIIESGYFRALDENKCELVSDTIFIYANTYKNVDTLKDVIYMYYKDSIQLENIIKENSTGKYVCNSIDFGIDNNKLYLKSPNSLKLTDYDLTITNQSSNHSISLKIKIQTWIKNKYSLTPVVKDIIPKFIYTHNDTTYSVENEKLFYSVKNKIEKSFCSNFKLADLMYNQMISRYGFYAFRTGGLIYVSKDLKNWNLIYNDKRGIKESMVIVKNKNGYELLFSEYTPGTTFVRQYLRSYNFLTKEMTTRMTFYTPDDFKSQGLTPQARHIHFLVQDNYSDLIFMGTGDYDNQSNIYFSTDSGLSFKTLGGGNQKWRSLTMFFDKDYIFWNMDSTSPQYIIRLKRTDIKENVDISKTNQYPLINSALWCSENVKVSGDAISMVVMSSNTEGRMYDENFRNYGIIIKNNEPVVYELFARKASNVYSQWYPIGIDYNNDILFLDLDTHRSSYYKVDVPEISKLKPVTMYNNNKN